MAPGSKYRSPAAVAAEELTLAGDAEDPMPPPAEGKAAVTRLQLEGAGDEEAGSVSSGESDEGRTLWRAFVLKLADLAVSANEWISFSLRTRCLLWMGLLVVALVGATAAIAVTVFPESFDHIERAHMEENVRRFAIAMQTDLLSFRDKLVVSYAQWDDTKTMVLRATESATDPLVLEYFDANFPANLFDSLGIEYALFYDLDGRRVADTKREGITVPDDLRLLDPEGPLWGRGKGCGWSRAGFFSSNQDQDKDENEDEDVDRVFIVAAASVCGSSGEGEPVGTAVFSRRLSGRELSSLAVRTQLCATVSALPFADREPPDIEEAAARLPPPYVASEQWPWGGGGTPLLRAMPQGYLDAGGEGFDETRRCFDESGTDAATFDRVAAYFSIASLFPGDDPVLFRLDRRRDFVATGASATRLMFLSLLVIGAIFYAAMLLFLEFMVLRPLSSITGQIRRIATTDDTSSRIVKPRFHAYDEIGLLAEALNLTLAVIQRSREAVAKVDEDARELLYSTCPRPLAERLMGGEALVTGSRAVGTAVCLRFVSVHPEHSDPRGCAVGLVLPRDQAPTTEVLPGQVEQTSHVHVWNTILLSLDRLCAERGLDGFSLAGGDTLLAVTGLPKWSEDHARQAVQLAQDAAELVERVASFFSIPIAAQIGVASGWMMCGVVRRPALKRYLFNVWGAPIEEASRLAAAAHPGRVAASVEGDARAAAAALAAENCLFDVLPLPAPGEGGGEGGGECGDAGGPRLSMRPPFRARRIPEGEPQSGAETPPPPPPPPAAGPAAAPSPRPQPALARSMSGLGRNALSNASSPAPNAAFVELQRRAAASRHLDRLLPGSDADRPPEPSRDGWTSHPMPSLFSEAGAAAAAGGGLMPTMGNKRKSVRVGLLAMAVPRRPRAASGSQPASTRRSRGAPSTAGGSSARRPGIPSRTSEMDAAGVRVPGSVFVRTSRGAEGAGAGAFADVPGAVTALSVPPSPRATPIGGLAATFRLVPLAASAGLAPEASPAPASLGNDGPGPP